MTTGEGTSAADSKHPGQRATVLQKLANGMFRLQMTDGREVVAHTALDLRMAFSRLLPGETPNTDVRRLFVRGFGRHCPSETADVSE